MYSTNKRLKVLVSTYACSPELGSEASIGWGFVSNLAKTHDVYVITQYEKFKPAIDRFAEKHPYIKQVNFHGINRERNEKLEKFWPPAYYWTYADWQQQAYELAKKLNETHQFDVVHQLNMIGYREPGFLWKLNVPFVWGPVGGIIDVPWPFIFTMGLKGAIFHTGRNVVNILHRNFLKRPKLAAKRAGSNGGLFLSYSSYQKQVEKLWNVKTSVISENGPIDVSHLTSASRNSKEKLKLVWSGQHIYVKSLNLLLKALSLLDSKVDYELHILGVGPRTAHWKGLAESLKVNDKCIWHGWKTREQCVEIMSGTHLFIHTSLKDDIPTVIMEAFSLKLPILCLDHCGFGYAVDETCGIKVRVGTPKQATRDLAERITQLFYDEDYRKKLSDGTIKRLASFNWDDKMKQLYQLYNNTIESATKADALEKLN